MAWVLLSLCVLGDIPISLKMDMQAQGEITVPMKLHCRIWENALHKYLRYYVITTKSYT